MHILVISPYLVGEYSLGGAKRIFRMVRHFAREAEVSFASFSDTQSLGNLWRSEIHGICRNVITAPLTRSGPISKAVNFFRSEPAPFYYYRSEELQGRILDLVRKGEIDFVHVEFFDMAPFAWNLPPAIARVLVSQEIFSFARKFSRSASDHFKRIVQTPKTRAFEKRAAQCFNRVYCITDEERRYLQSLGIEHCHIYSHVVDTSEFNPSDPMLEEEGALLFLGNFDHRPNLDALYWFIKDILPLVRNGDPRAVLHVVGPNLDMSFLGGLNTGQVCFHGEVRNLQDFYDKAAIFVNPIVSGGGMRGKVLEAMAKAKAIVSTRLGVQGIHVRNGETVVLAETPPEFADGILRLLGNRERRIKLGRLARNDVCVFHDEQIIFEKLLGEYREIMEGKS